MSVKYFMFALILTISFFSTPLAAENRFMVGQPCSLLSDGSFKDALINGVSGKIMGKLNSILDKISQANSVLQKDCFGLDKLARDQERKIENSLDSKVDHATNPLDDGNEGMDTLLDTIQTDITIK